MICERCGKQGDAIRRCKRNDCPDLTSPAQEQAYWAWKNEKERLANA